MKKRLNGKLLLGISAVLAVLTWGVRSLHSFQVRRAAGALAERGIQAEQEGNLQEAARYLGRYLVYAPQDLPILEKYCAVLEKAGAPQQTQWQLLEMLDDALRIRPDQPPLRRHAAYLAMDLQQYADARHHLETLLVANPEDVELEQTRARCLAALGAYDHAAATYCPCRRLRRNIANGDQGRACWPRPLSFCSKPRYCGRLLPANLLRARRQP